jgi:hypothetical protein
MRPEQGIDGGRLEPTEVEAVVTQAVQLVAGVARAEAEPGAKLVHDLR